MTLTDDQRTMLDVPEGVWDGLRGARIFLTGGTGFFGHALLASFAAANEAKQLGATITVLSRNPAAHAADYTAIPSIHFHTGDVRNFAFPEGHFTYVIHAATESSGGQHQHDDLHMVDTIVNGTRRVLDFATQCGAPRVLYVSSGAVYGRSRNEAVPMAETDATGPKLSDAGIAYDESKRMAEALCQLYAKNYNLPVVIARGFSFVGPHLPLDAHFAIGNFIGDALAGRTIAVNGDGSAVRSYLYTADLARYLWTLLVKGERATAYNVGGPDAISIAGLAAYVQQAVNPDVEVAIAQTAVEGAPINYQVPDTARAEALGLTPLVSLDEAIRRTAAWHRAHPVPKKTASAPSMDPILKKPDVVVFDFDGVMTDNRVAVLEDGREAVFCNRSDGLGIGMLKKAGVPMLVLSTETNPVVAARCKKLGLECLQGIDRKELALAAWLKEKGYDAQRTIYLGNDINDLGCLALVGLPAVVGDAYPEVKAIAKLVLTRHGGKGAVRELCDRILAARAIP